MRCGVLILVSGLAACGSPEPPEARARPEPAPQTVFDPLTSTIGRAEGVQETIDAQAAEQRRRLEEAER